MQGVCTVVASIAHIKGLKSGVINGVPYPSASSNTPEMSNSEADRTNALRPMPRIEPRAKGEGSVWRPPYKLHRYKNVWLRELPSLRFQLLGGRQSMGPENRLVFG